MGFFDKVFGKDVPLSELLQRDNFFHEGSCEECGASFLFPEYPITYWAHAKKPTGELDVGGWCFVCHRTICHRHAEYVQFPLEGRDWWVAGCASCHEPLGSRVHREQHGGS